MFGSDNTQISVYFGPPPRAHGKWARNGVGFSKNGLLHFWAVSDRAEDKNGLSVICAKHTKYEMSAPPSCEIRFFFVYEQRNLLKTPEGIENIAHPERPCPDYFWYAFLLQSLTPEKQRKSKKQKAKTSVMYSQHLPVLGLFGASWPSDWPTSSSFYGRIGVGGWGRRAGGG